MRRDERLGGLPLLLAAAAGLLVGSLDRTRSETADSNARSNRWSRVWQAIAATALATAAAALVFIAYNQHAQYVANQHLARAYVGIDTGYVRYVRLIEGGHGLLVHVTMRNFGQTPGYDLTSWLRPPVVRPADAVPFDRPPPVSERGGKLMMGPQTTVNLFWTVPVSEEELAGLRTGKLNIFVWGGVDYTDVFGNDRHFIFRTVNATAALLSKPGDQAALKPHSAGYSAK